MKRFVLLFIFLMPLASQLFANIENNNLRVIVLGGKGGLHFEHFVPADLPDVYYDSDEQEVIIDGDGEVNYYDVEITSATSWIVYISTQVSGTYDTIDVSSLPDGVYCITIYSPTGNEFEGFFDTY